jgi:pectin methylesterase-like acyl-CoA thioesterase
MLKRLLTKVLLLTALFISAAVTVHAQAPDVVVAKDGSGNFLTLQAAIDAAPAARTTPYRIFVKKGKYVEKVTIPSTKTFLYIIGEGINETNISWDDYAGKAGVTEIATVTINANDCAMMNLTIENSWGRKYDGPQALALKANADRLIFKNCKLVSGQDTVMANGNGKKQYYRNCYIDGNTDYIYGSAIAVFDSCVIYNRDRLDGSSGSVFTAASTPSGQTYGYVFRDCLLPNNNGQTTYTLGRPWGNSDPPHTSETKVVFLNCRMGTTVSPARWQVWSAGTDTTIITYVEYKTKYFNGTTVDLSKRVTWSKEFSDAQAAPYFVNSNMFGTWDPCAVLADACVPFSPIITLSNYRVNRSSSQSTFRFNICWPISGVTYELHRSTDSLTGYASVNSFVSTTDTSVACQFIDALPAAGVSYFYKVIAKKTGFATYTTDTILKVNTSIPLNGEFRSSGSGYFANASTGTYINTTSIWEKYDGSTNTWVAQALGTRPSNVNVTIRSGHTVTLDALAGITSLTIESGATLNATGTATGTTQTIRIGSGTSPVTSLIKNDGMFGSTSGNNDGIILEAWTTCSNLTITGAGTTSIARFRPSPGNTSGTPPVLNMIIDQDMTFGYNNVCFTGYYNSSSNTTSEVVNITINAGKTVRLSNASGQFHLGTTTANAEGNITYNINGTLDLSVGSTSNMVPSSVSPTSTTAVNVNNGGLLKLGTSFGMTNGTATGTFGTARININEGGVVDATKTTTLNASGAANSGMFIMSGSGVLKRLVGNTATTFPVSANINSYNPVTLTNAGIADTFFITLDTSFIYAPAPDTLKAVRRQWSINEFAPGGSDVTVGLGWTTNEQAASFNPAAPINVLRYNGSSWVSTVATVTGAGSKASPYMATAAGYTSFSPFIVSNDVALPVSLLSFNAGFNNNLISLLWKTTNEINTLFFNVEKSIDGRTFEKLATVQAKGSILGNTYTMDDAHPYNGVSYYRLKIIDKDGSFKYSPVVAVNVKTKGLITIYPNPVSSTLLLTHDKAAMNATVELVTLDGRRILSQLLNTGALQTTVHVESLPPGAYMLLLNNGDQKHQLKFIKQ